MRRKVAVVMEGMKMVKQGFVTINELARNVKSI